MPNYNLGPDCLTIYNSYRVRKKNMRPILEQIKRDCKYETKVFERSFFSMKMEWLCHNALYFAGIERDRTRDVDLDNPTDRPEWQYIICGLLVWILVW